jgi:ADP-ribosylglycohydrolase
MSIALARKLSRQGSYNRKLAAEAYRKWIESKPFRLEKDLDAVLAERAENAESDMSAAADGSVLIRCAPIAMISVRLRNDIRLATVAEWAKEDMSLTHPDKECADVAAIFACLLSNAIEYGARGESLFNQAAQYARMLEVDEPLLAAVRSSSDSGLESMPKGPLRSLCCILRHAARAKSPEKAVLAAVMAGEQPSAHASAVGALVGAQSGLAGLPASWDREISVCRPKSGQQQVRLPRPREYWPADLHSLTASLSWSAGASAVPAQHRGKQEKSDDNLEQEMRREFEGLVEKAATTGCKESLHKLGEMAHVEKGINASHKYMFSDFARTLRKRNWLQLALLHAARAAALSPEDSHTHFNLARIHWLAGDGNNARKALAETLRIVPDMEHAKALLEQIDNKASENG